MAGRWFVPCRTLVGRSLVTAWCWAGLIRTATSHGLNIHAVTLGGHLPSAEGGSRWPGNGDVMSDASPMG
jgi:hypothetical protein